MSNQAKGLAALLAAHGRNGDTELVHVSKDELRAIDRLGSPHGIKLTTNPHTGLKEAFNWGSTLGAIAGGIGGTFAAPFTAGVINPYTGAALGSAAGTKISGGSNEEALMNGVISGVTAWGIGGATDALAQAGQEAGKTAVQEGVKTGVQEAVPAAIPGADAAFGSTGNAFVGQGAGPNVFAGAPLQTTPTTPLPQGIEAFAKPDAGAMAAVDPGYYGAESLGPQGVNTYTSQGTKEMVAAGAPVGSTSSVAPGANTLSQSGANADYWSNVQGGIKSLDTPGKASDFAVANKGSLLAGGLGAYGMATDAGADQTTGTDITGSAPNSTMNYRGEVYYTPYGERRTRAVAMAEGGLTFSDYDASDADSSGGYAPGGLASYAGGGGIGFIDSIQPGGKWGDITADAYGVMHKNMPGFINDATPGGFIGATTPGKQQYLRREQEEAERKKREEAEGIAAAAKAKEKADFEQQWSTRYGAPVTMADGGLSSLGHYSDGGQLLRGPGDGVSDSIPASIEGKRPARLADGEFVIPARAVSELGNGSTEAGSKQLYAMLDRIAKKRKGGKGLAYTTNPKKMLPA